MREQMGEKMAKLVQKATHNQPNKLDSGNYIDESS